MIYSAVPLILGWAFVVDYNSSGVRSFYYSLEKSSVMITPLFPAQRLFGIDDGRQRLKKEPVYFHVRYPRGYRKADVIISVDNPHKLKWGIGLETGGGEWSYEVKTPDPTGFVSFDLRQAKITDHSLRFMITVPGFSSDATFAVDAISVILRDKL